MFSFTGDTVVDPFAGTGSTALAAMETGRHSVSVEIDPRYVTMMEQRLHKAVVSAVVVVERPGGEPVSNLPIAL
jgi:DNA modification methylase